MFPLFPLWDGRGFISEHEKRVSSDVLGRFNQHQNRRPGSNQLFYTHVCVCARESVHSHTQTHKHIHVHACTHTWTHVGKQPQARTHARTHKHIHTHSNSRVWNTDTWPHHLKTQTEGTLNRIHSNKTHRHTPVSQEGPVQPGWHVHSSGDTQWPPLWQWRLHTTMDQKHQHHHR